MLLSVLLLVSATQATHYRGTVMTYYPKETYTNGSVSVTLYYKLNFDSCLDGTFTCSGNCGAQSLILPYTKIDGVSGSWCQSEKITSWLLPNNSQMKIVIDGGNWIGTKNNIVSWRAVTDVELRNRSDTNKPNSSPQTTVFPILQVPSNCRTNINLLAFDPDGDEVQCRYANNSLEECKSPCTPSAVLSLSSNCTLSFSATSSSNEGYYAVEMVMQDFPRQTITLSQTNGSQVVKTSSDAISKIPIQFALRVDPAAQSCTEGHYLPRFVSPTPGHRAQFHCPINQTLKINITAEATMSVISGLLFSGPHDVVKKSLGSGKFTLTWTPSESEAGQSHPICFVVEANFSSSVYQSELRCVIVTVTNRDFVPPTIPSTSSDPPPKTSYRSVLKMKISTKLPLRDNRVKIAEAIKDELIKRGLPSNIQVRLLSNGSGEAKIKASPSG